MVKINPTAIMDVSNLTEGLPQRGPAPFHAQKKNYFRPKMNELGHQSPAPLTRL
jgi:hypothetical protein